LAPTVLSLAGLTPPPHMQGQPFLGDQRPPEREYIYAARDRMDETNDIIRAVRDKRFKYIRNYLPEKPYSQPIAYMDEMPTMKEWRRLNKEGKLVGPQTLFFQSSKPLEELYDTDADPHEVHNLVDNPEHQATLARLRAAHEKWREETNDLGLIPEAALNERVRPAGKWSVTADPKFEVAGGMVSLRCDTKGASIAYRPAAQKEEEKGKVSWSLYSKPFAATAGAKFQAKACRLGFKDSDVVRISP